MKLSRLAFLSTFLPTTLALAPRALAQAGEWGETCQVDTVATIRGVECLVGNILAVAITAIGFAGFVMLLIGSFLYLTSGGNSKGVTAGKQTLTYAVVGLIVAVMSMFVLNFIAAFTGVNTILDFRLSI